VKHLSLACFLCNIIAKIYENWRIFAQVAAKTIKHLLDTMHIVCVQQIAAVSLVP